MPATVADPIMTRSNAVMIQPKIKGGICHFAAERGDIGSCTTVLQDLLENPASRDDQQDHGNAGDGITHPFHDVVHLNACPDPKIINGQDD